MSKLLQTFILLGLLTGMLAANQLAKDTVTIEQILGDGSLSKQVRNSQQFKNLPNVKIEQRERASTKDALIVPTTKVKGQPNISYIGQIKGFIEKSFLDYIKIVQTKNTGLKKNIQALNKPVKIRVLATPTCPYCNTMATNMCKLGYLDSAIEVEIININDFQDLAMYYNVRGVPLTIINEKYSVPGAVPVETMLEYLKQIK